MPRGARLTVGRNNGDSTWTLTDREIDTVAYIPPRGAMQPPELALRITAMPSGQTITLLDLSVLATKLGYVSAAVKRAEQTHKRDDGALEDDATAVEDTGLPDDSTSEQTTLPAKNDDRMQARLAETLALWQSETADALKDAEATWKAEEAARFAQARAQWQEETAKAVAQALARAGRGPQQNDNLATALADAERHWKAGEAARHAAAELQSQKKFDAAVADAWAEAERRWQTKLETAVAEARAEAATNLRAEDGGVQRLRSEMTAARSTLAKCEIELAAAREEIERLRSDSQHRVEAALQQAEAKWKAGEAARRAEAEAQWREQTGKAVAEALSSAENTRDARSQHELDRASAELSAARVSLAELTAESTELHAAFSQAQTDWQREKEAALSGAENAWRAAEATRLAVAKAEWQAQSDKALAGARAETEAVRKQFRATGSDRLREKLAERENELTQLRAALLEERRRLQQEASEQLAESEKNWKIDEISRMTQAKEQWQAQTAKAVADARAGGAGRDTANSIELRRLHAEYTALQATLAAREQELSRAQMAAGIVPDDRIILKQERIRSTRETDGEEEERNRRGKGGIVLGVAVVAALAGCAVILFPNIQAALWPGPQPEVTVVDTGPAPAPAAASPATKQAVVVRGANVRSAPSGDAEVVLTLTRGTKVTPVEQRGSWTRIQVRRDDGSGQPQEGWIFTSFLKDGDSL